MALELILYVFAKHKRWLQAIILMHMLQVEFLLFQINMLSNFVVNWYFMQNCRMQSNYLQLSRVYNKV